MLYNTGTIAINGNTATGTGTNWTAPASQVRAGQTIIVMSSPVQIFQISSVDSSTSMTVTPSASPALSGQKYGILVSDNISVDGLAQAMSQLIKEYDENIGAWETFATTSANQTITVTINGSSVSIPGIGALARKGVNSDITELKGLTTALSIAQGGTGATTAEGSRTNLGLGSSATKDVGTASGNVMKVGAFGLGGQAVLLNDADISSPISGSQLFMYGGQGFWGGWGAGLKLNYGGSYNFQIYLQGQNGTLATLVQQVGGAAVIRSHYNDGNTTVDTNGFIKKASPVVRLFGDGILKCNDEAEGVTATRESTGVYHVAGSLGLNSDGWTVEVPQDINGNFLCFVEISAETNGLLHVSTFKRRFDVDFAMIVAGEPMDIPDERWIDLRLDMPEDSIWNRKQTEYQGIEGLITGDNGS